MKSKPIDKRLLKSKAHALNPIIIVGSKGLTDNICLETDRALETHELIKLRINADNKEERQQIIHAICEYCKATLIQSIGHTATIYRQRQG